MRLLVILVFEILGVIGMAARLISGFHGGSQFRLPGEPEPLVEPSQQLTKGEAIGITAAVLSPLVALMILAAMFSR